MHKYLLIALLLLIATPHDANAARLWSSGCEFQSDAPGTPTPDLEFSLEQSGASTYAISTTIKRSGLSSCSSTGSGGWAQLGHQFVSSPSTAAHYARFYFYIDTSPSGNTQVASWYNGADLESSFAVTSTRTLILVDDTNATVDTYATPLSEDTWYRVEMFYRSSDDSLAVRLDGSEVMSATCGGCDGADFFYIGVDDVIGSPSGTYYFDDIALNDSSGGSQTSYPGAGSIVHMQPDGAGDNSGCTAGTYASVDEVTPDDASTICTLTTDGGGDILDTTVESSSSAGIDSYDTVSLVQVGVGESATTAASESWQLRVKSASGGTVSSSATMTHDDTTYKTNGDVNPAFPGNYPLTSYTDPTTGIAWTPTGTNSLDSMQIGITSIDANPDIRVTTLWGLIEYVDGSPPAAVEKMRSRVAGGRVKVQSGRFILRSN